eukprot:CAMPEP_0202866862 /NCGR_PEP_ID=MMETSP1391-20130828/8400_1 /ASSEMBLY_ACC=CAM_ASM_000867 /TAXON_ID=1034604 /ORGANISM="Chlamydomonas leiostraca, Strain SAG 11-49" /LENGTH=316 /DNA_ID=CAMNT_0049546849 /DNA_START=28 /DNA_END=975 /DNA_ORIENTATION=+
MSSNYQKFPGPEEDPEEKKPLVVPTHDGAGSSGYAYEAYQAPYQTPQNPNVVPAMGYPSAPIPPQYIQNVPMEPVVQRTWRGHFCQFWGQGSDTDCLSCLLAWIVPCLPFGMNSARALRMNWVHEAAKFLAAVCALSALNIAYRAVCPSNPSRGGWRSVGGGDGEGGEQVLRVEYQDSHCDASSANFLASMLLVASICLAYWAASRRAAMRARFGIEGSALCDFLTWWCCGCCALAQETRTLAASNVYDGTWHGPLVAPVVPGAIPGTGRPLSAFERVMPGVGTGGMLPVQVAPLAQPQQVVVISTGGENGQQRVA